MFICESTKHIITCFAKTKQIVWWKEWCQVCWGLLNLTVPFCCSTWTNCQNRNPSVLSRCPLKNGSKINLTGVCFMWRDSSNFKLWSITTCWFNNPVNIRWLSDISKFKQTSLTCIGYYWFAYTQINISRSPCTHELESEILFAIRINIS